MSISQNINGVWRETWSTAVNVNGVWREADVYSNVNGVWRENYNIELTEEDIIGFRIVYKLNKNKKHPIHSHLVYNSDLPARIALTGDTAGSMDFERKGVVFEYENTYPEREGIMMYEGKLYAVLKNDQVIDIGQTKEFWSNDDRLPSNAPDITEVWATNKISNLSIQIEAYLLYESNGFYFAGWNSLFNKTQFTDPTLFPDGEDKNIHYMNSYNILPIESRENTFDSIASIGIARDMHMENTNMVGSYGNLDHTIYWITVNGIKKPFVFEIYE